MSDILIVELEDFLCKWRTIANFVIDDLPLTAVQSWDDRVKGCYLNILLLPEIFHLRRCLVIQGNEADARTCNINPPMAHVNMLQGTSIEPKKLSRKGPLWPT